MFTGDEREELAELFSLLVRFPLLNRTFVEGGAELLWLNDLKGQENDLTSSVLALQFTNQVAYQGYQLTTQMGMKFDRRKLRGQKARTTSETFITVFAGLGE